MKKKPNPIPTADDLCEECGKAFACTHEVFFGNPDAALSQIWGMTRKLCQYDHQDHKAGVHHNRKFDLRLKKEYQKRFEDLHGHEKFMEVFKRNYL